MARDIDEEINEAMADDFDYASLDEDYDYDTTGSILVDTYAFITHEIRRNPKFEEMFELVNEEKNAVINEKNARFKEENDAATGVIVSNSQELNELENDFEDSIGQEINRIDYFTYEIDSVEYSKDDLGFVDVEREEYEDCLAETKELKTSVRKLEKAFNRAKLASKFAFRRDTSYRSEEYQISCLLVSKREKLLDGEAFLRRYEFINSLSEENYKKLRLMFAKAEIIGNALEVLENNGKEQEELGKSEGQSQLVEGIFEKKIEEGVISQADYDELIKFIEDTKQKVSEFDEYNFGEIPKDDSDIGSTVYGFVYEIDTNSSKDKAFSEMIDALRENKEDDVEENIEDKEIEETETIEENGKEEDTKKVEETEKGIKAEDSEAKVEEATSELGKEAEDNLIVSFILESNKLMKVVEKIQNRERKIYVKALNHKLDEAYKNERLAIKEIEEDMSELSEMLGVEVSEDNGECYFGNLAITVEDLSLAYMSEKEYETKLDLLDNIKRDERKITRDINSIRRREKIDVNRGNNSACNLFLMNKKRDKLTGEKENIQRELKIAEWFSGLTEREISIINVFVETSEFKITTSKRINELTEKIVELDEKAVALDEPEYRQSIMEKALTECVKDGEISKAENKELFDSILKIRKELRCGKYQGFEDYGRDESESALVVYDYINLLDRNIEELKKKKEQEQEKNKDKDDDDGNIDI